ncbi:MAG: hypothetical protein IT175_19135 [Acidobacteria bacterium]|nr:hypothetical protein [Acidobacteriota bacterium]
MSRRPLIAFGLSLFLCIAAASSTRAAAGDDLVHLTVYDAGIAEFLEVRTLELQTGLNTIEWRSLMPKAHLRTLRVMAADAEVVRQDITMDGAEVRGEKTAVVHLQIMNRGAAGPRKVVVDYLAPNVSWQSDCALVLDPGPNGAPPVSATLDIWLSVFNSTGLDLRAGSLDLVAGEINLVDGGGGFESRRVAQYQVNAQSNAFYTGDDEGEGDTSTTVTGLSVFNRLALGKGIALNANNTMSRFPLMQRTKIGVEERKVFENAYNAQTFGRNGFTLLPRGLDVRLVSKNTTGVPIPAGVVTVYARTGDLMQIAGQDRIGLTAEQAEFTVSQGRSATLFGSRRVVERKTLADELSSGGRRERLVTKVEVVLTNRGTLEADAFVREGIEPYDENRWTLLAQSHASETLGANTIQFKVKVPPGGKTVVSYTVETK